MTAAVTVEPLTKRPELVPLVAEWFVSEWPSWYGPGGQGNVARDLEAFAKSESVLPVGLVAFEKRVPVGAGVLKAGSIPSHSHLSPWAGAGFVLPALRGKGIGAALLRALVAKASELGYPCVYCGTSTSQSLLARAGWTVFEHTFHEGKPLTIFRSAA